MALFLGIDTERTYTDTVLLRKETDVIESAKLLTRRHDLAFGIGKAVQDVLSQ